jgi:hypothetical protein
MKKMDRLLKQALRDDMPPEVEKGMKQQLNLFREKMAEYEHAAQQRVGLFQVNGKDLAAVRNMFKQGTLAFASILLVVVGSLMQLSGGQNILAESISTWNVAMRTYDQVRFMDSMACRVEATVPGLTKSEKPVKYTIRWVSSNRRNQYRVHAVYTGPSGQRTEKKLVVGNNEHIDDPLFQPVAKLFSPSGLRGLLAGKWKLKHYRREGTCEWGTFNIANPDKKGNTKVEMTADLCTWLPVHMEIEDTAAKTKMDIHFNWDKEEKK